jgi:hypothetical protein
MTIVRPLLITVALGSFALTACATSTEPRAADSVDAALQQPMRDLSLLQDAPPPAALTKAAAGPYLTEGLGDCPAIAQELAALDAVLGRDIDGPVAAGDRSSRLAAGLIGEVFGLPFRGVVRQISGAQQREATRQAAVLAGMVRRAFLKGRATLACPQPPVR